MFVFELSLRQMSLSGVFTVKVRDQYDDACFLLAVRADDTASSIVKAALEHRKSRSRNPGATSLWSESAVLRLEDGTLVPGDIAAGLFCERNTLLHLGATATGANVVAVQQQASGDIWVRLNVGGEIVVTSRATLLSDKDSMLARMFGEKWAVECLLLFVLVFSITCKGSRTDETGAVMLDLDPRYFAPILNYLRFGTLALDSNVSADGVRATAAFLQVKGVLALLKQERKANAPRK
jgi:hypothetical protein